MKKQKELLNSLKDNLTLTKCKLINCWVKLKTKEEKP